MNESCSELLERAASVYGRSRSQHRDALLECGRLLHEYVLAWVRQGDGMCREARQKVHYTREHAIKMASDSLRVSTSAVSRFISTAMSVGLLAEGGAVGRLSYATINLFHRFIRRQTGVAGGKASPDHGGKPISLAETWEVRPGVGDRASRLFRTAVREDLRFEQVRPAVLSLYDATFKDRPHRIRRHEEEKSALETLRLQARVAAPGDVAELCMDLIRAAEDPAAVAVRLRVFLAKFLPQKKQRA